MRWFWIDRFDKFVVGQEAVTVKNVTLGEEPLDDYLPPPHTTPFPDYRRNGTDRRASTAGSNPEFQQRAVLAKVNWAPLFHRMVGPGDQLRLTGVLSLQDDGGHRPRERGSDEQPQAEMELTFGFSRSIVQ
ncbi:MAG: hypothetical protein R3C56_22845 [Pirellulaceae bacterium]